MEQSQLDASMLGRPYKELLDRVRSAKPDDFQIYTCKEDEVTAFLVTSNSKKRSLLMCMVMPATRGQLHDRIITSHALMDGDRISPKSCWFQVAVETRDDSGAVVSFFLPSRVELPLPEMIVKENVLNPSGLLSTAEMVLCIVTYTGKKALSLAAINHLGSCHFLPFICSFCGIFSSDHSKLNKCDRCKEAFYCNKECQKQHWVTRHKAECGTCVATLVDRSMMDFMMDA